MSTNCWGLSLVAVAMLVLTGNSHSQSQPAKTGDEVKVQILVPIADLPPYHLFQDSKKFKLVEYPKSKLREDVSDTFTNFDQIKGKTSRHYKLKANEPIYQNDICDVNQDDIVWADRNGEVAHAFNFSPDRYPASFIKQGYRVDIQATVPPTTPGDAPVTLFLLENIEVIALDNTDKKIHKVLLKLTRPQSLVLKYFQDTAKVDIVRRKSDDSQRVQHHMFALTPEIITSPSAFETSPEQKVLNQWLGFWEMKYTQPKSEWTPLAKAGRAEVSMGSVMGGRYIQESSFLSDQTSNRTLFTYDTQKKQYRAWWFSSNGQTSESTGLWDDKLKTMTWTSIGDSPNTTTMKQHFVNKDTIDWEVVTQDRAGKMLFQMKGTTKRLGAMGN